MKISSYIKNASWFATLGAVMLLSAQMGEAQAQGICGRTTEVQTVIIAAIPDTPACGDVTANQLANVNPVGGLTIDSLDSAGETLRVGDFAGLSGLSRLNLAGNDRLGSVALPAGLFNGLSTLTTLNLSGNEFLGSVVLPAGLFNGLNALTTLVLSGNRDLGRLLPLSAGLFNGLSALTTLDLSGNPSLGRVTLPAELFNDLSALTTLDLSDNRFFIALPAGFFNDLSALTTLNLSRGLDLGRFFALPAGLFNGLNTLATLDLSGNQYLDSTDLPDGIFHDALNTLTNLRLDDRLRGMMRMSTVTSAIDAIGATGITVTRTAPYTAVNVAYTAAYGGSAEDAHFTDETGTLEFAAGQTSAIINVTSNDPPFNSTVTITLGTLHLPADMRAVPSTANVAEIVAVDPANNAHTLTVVHAGICNRTLEVQTAIIDAIPDTPACGAVTAGQLAAINPVNGLSIDSLNSPGDILRVGDFAGLSGLRRLDLSGNQTLGIVALPAGLFDGLSTLTTLDMSGNQRLGIFALPAGLFNGLSTLTTLDLSGNQNLGRVALPAGLFDGLNDLTTLDMSGNRDLGIFAATLPAGLFDGLDALVTLHLNSNPNLTSLPDDLLDDVLDTLTGLRLDAGLRRTLGLSVNLNSLVQGGAVIFQLNVGTALEAGLGVRVPYTAAFGGGGTADHFTGLSASGTMDIAPGMTDATLEVTAPGNAPAGAIATVTLGVPSLLYDGDNDDSSDEVKTGALTSDDPVFNLVRVDTGNNEQTITIGEDAIRLRIRTFLEGALQ